MRRRVAAENPHWTSTIDDDTDRDDTDRDDTDRDTDRDDTEGLDTDGLDTGSSPPAWPSGSPEQPQSPPAWNPQPWQHPDDLDGFSTASQRFLDRAKGWLGALVALALIVPAGAGLIDTWLFDRARDDVLEQLADDPVDAALVEAVLLVTVASCDGSTGSGTAFVADVDGQRLLLTNRHVVDDAATVGLRTLAGNGGPSVVGTRLSQSADLAVLEVAEGTELPPPLPLARDAPAERLPVRTVGFPLALPYTSTGTVSETGARVLLDLQVDPGASGSPVVDERGRVVAQVYARTDDSRGVATSAAALRAGLATLQPRDLGC